MSTIGLQTIVYICARMWAEGAAWWDRERAKGRVFQEREVIRWAFALIATFGATPALADWQYTRWGMTPDQVIAASGGAVHRKSLTEQEINASFAQAGLADLLEGTYSAGGRSFDATFRFARTGLETVLLRFDEPAGTAACSGLRDDLLGSYGTPVEERRGVTTWLDRRSGNRVSYTSLGIGSCYVMYSRSTAGGL